jgi:peroxiredoxin
MMMRPFLPFLAIATLCSCTGNGGRTIELHIEGAGGRLAYFDRFENNIPYHIDSVKLDATGSGRIKVPALPLDFYRISVGDEHLVIALDSADSPVINTRLGQLTAAPTITGAPHSEAMYAFQAEAARYDAERDRLRAMVAANPTDTATLAQLNKLNADFHDHCSRFIEEHSASPAALTAISRMDMQRDMPLFQKVRNDLRKTMRRSTYFAMFRDRVDRQEQQELMVKMQEEEMKRLSNLLPIGSEAPEIRQQTPDGATFALSQLRGKYVLIDFWASWCRPCRIENPNVKLVYEKYHKKGFEILGVSLDRDHAAWLKAIKDDGLPWKHVSDLGFWNNAAAQEYGVSSIPFTVLVDREGRIVAKGLRAHDLEAKLAELL